MASTPVSSLRLRTFRRGAGTRPEFRWARQRAAARCWIRFRRPRQTASASPELGPSRQLDLGIVQAHLLAETLSVKAALAEELEQFLFLVFRVLLSSLGGNDGRLAEKRPLGKRVDFVPLTFERPHRKQCACSDSEQDGDDALDKRALHVRSIEISVQVFLLCFPEVQNLRSKRLVEHFVSVSRQVV